MKNIVQCRIWRWIAENREGRLGMHHPTEGWRKRGNLWGTTDGGRWSRGRKAKNEQTHHITQRQEEQRSCLMVSHTAESNPHWRQHIKGHHRAALTPGQPCCARQAKHTAEILDTLLPKQPIKPLLFGKKQGDTMLPKRVWLCEFQVTV